MPSRKVQKFLEGIDAYAQPIQMAYKGQKQYPTSCGGVMTILHFTLFITFFTFVGLIIAGVNWNISTFTLSNTFYGYYSNGDPAIFLPTEYLEKDSYAPAFKYITTGDLTQDDLKKTVQAYYLQYNGTHDNYIEAVYCDQIYTQKKYLEMFGRESLMICPNTDNKDPLQLGTDYMRPRMFRLVIGTCNKTSNLTGITDCYDEDKAISNLAQIFVNSYITEVVPSPYKIFDDLNPTYNVRFFSQGLLNSTSTAYNIDIDPVNASFAYNWFYSNFQQLNQNFYSTRAVNPPNYLDLDTKALQMYTFSLSGIAISSGWARSSFMSMIGDLGGITAILVFAIGGLVQTYANFNIDNSMIEKLYTVPKTSAQPSNKKAHSASLNEQSSDQLIEGNEFTTKGSFPRPKLVYRLSLALVDFVKGNCCCCFCNKCLCKQSKMNERFHKAQDKLYGEIDLIKLIRVLRFSKFVSSGNLQKHHWFMVDNFDQYCIKDDDSSGSSSDSDQPEQGFDSKGDDLDDDSDENEEQEALDWYCKPKNQAKFAKSLAKSKMNYHSQVKCQNWIDQVSFMSQLKNMKKDFKPQLKGGVKQDLLAFKQIIGAAKVTQDMIDTVKKEIDEEGEVTKRNILDFAESQEGSEFIKILNGGESPKYQLRGETTIKNQDLSIQV